MTHVASLTEYRFIGRSVAVPNSSNLWQLCQLLFKLLIIC